MGGSGAAKRAPMPADPRPELAEEGDRSLLLGGRCSSCGLASAYTPPICSCGAINSVQACQFGPDGTVFSSTVLEIPVPGRPPPTCLAYIDLDEGPRILVHVEIGDGLPPLPGDKVSISGKNTLGDLVALPDKAQVSDNEGMSDD